MKKIIIIIVLSMSLMLIGGCTKNASEQDPLLELCDEIDVAVNDYESKNISKKEFIETIRSFDEKCSGDDYLCTSIQNFNHIEDSFQDEIIDAYTTQLTVGCKKIRDQKEQ